MVEIKIHQANKGVYEHVRKANYEGQNTICLDDLSSEMSTFSDEELRLTIMMDRQATGDIWPVAIALARSEMDRRAQDATEKLAMKTTQWSVGIGGAVAIVAAIAGALLSQ